MRADYKEQVSGQHSSMVSASVPASRFMPWEHSLGFFDNGLQVVRWNKPCLFPVWVVFEHGVHHNNRKVVNTGNCLIVLTSLNTRLLKYYFSNNWNDDIWM